MPIRFSCPTCTSVYSAPDAKAGARATCPKCRTRLTVPDTRPTELYRPPVRRPPTVACPGCGRPIPLDSHEWATRLRCARCATEFTPDGSAPPGVPATSPAVPAPQPVYYAPPPQPQLNYHVTETRSRNLWQWFVGAPVGILLLTITGLLVLPLCCCGGSLLVGLVQTTEHAPRQAEPPHPETR